jgi:hypothetical protein
VVAHLLEYCSETLLPNARQFAEIGDSQGTEIIQGSCVGCLAHLAVLCDLLSGLEPSLKPRMDVICDWSLERVGELTQGMSFDKYTHLDILLKVRCSTNRFLGSAFMLSRFHGRGLWPYLTLEFAV